MEELDYIEKVCRTEKERLGPAGLDGHLNGILSMLPGLKRKLTWTSPEVQLPIPNQDVIVIDEDGTVEAGFYSQLDQMNHVCGMPKHDWCDFCFEVKGWIPMPTGRPNQS